MDNWAKRLDVPSAMTDLKRDAFGLKLAALILKVFGCLKYAAQIRKLINWPRIVAHAAPLMPMSSTKIAKGSPIILMIAPVSIAAIAYLGLPSVRIMDARVFCVIARGIIAKIIIP